MKIETPFYFNSVVLSGHTDVDFKAINAVLVEKLYTLIHFFTIFLEAVFIETSLKNPLRLCLAKQ